MEPDEREEISQDELERYRKLSAEAKDLNWTVEAIRRNLIERHGRGVPVEPGELEVEITESEQRRMTNDELIRILGIEVIKNVKAAIRPSVVKLLKVVNRPVSPPKSRRRKAA